MIQNRILYHILTTIIGAVVLFLLLPLGGYRGVLLGLATAAFVLGLSFICMKRDAIGKVYYTYMAFGLATVVWMPLMWLTPLVWFVLVYWMNHTSIRALSASLLGILTPYWFWLSWEILKGSPEHMLIHAASMVTLLHSPLAVYESGSWNPHTVVTAMVVIMLGLSSIVFYNYMDNGKNTKEKQVFNALTALYSATVLMTLLQPMSSPWTLTFMAIATVPIIGWMIQITIEKWIH